MNTTRLNNQHFRPLLVFITVLWLCFFALRLAGPPDLRRHDQERPASYVMDVVQNGNWLCQTDFNGEIASKPPLYTWLAALATLPFERITRFSLYVSNALAVLITALIVFAAGSTMYSRNAGFLGAVFYIISLPGLKQLCLARTDPLFTMFTALSALLLGRAWTEKRGWTWFWLTAAAVTLTKGPLGFIIAAGGLWAFFWERKDGHRVPLAGAHLPGILLFLAITLGWFFAAWAAKGQAFIDKLLLSELLGHALGGYKDKVAGTGFYRPAFYVMTRFFPWSLLAVTGFWKIVRNPAPHIGTRTIERFLLCSFLWGLLLLSLASHQRSDLMFPLLPAAAVAAGRVAADRVHGICTRTLLLRAGAVCSAVLAAAGMYYFLFMPQDSDIQATLRLKDAAEYIDADLQGPVRTEYVGTYYTLQFYQNKLRPLISPDAARRLLAKPALVRIITVPIPRDRLQQFLEGIPFHVVLQSKDIMIIENEPPGAMGPPDRSEKG